MRPTLPSPASLIRPRRSTWAIGLILLLTVGAALPARPAAAAPRQVVVAAPGPCHHEATARPGPGRARRALLRRNRPHPGRRLRDYWEATRGTTLLGLPLTDEFAEQYTDGSTQTSSTSSAACWNTTRRRARPPNHRCGRRSAPPGRAALRPGRGGGQTFPTASPSAASSALLARYERSRRLRQPALAAGGRSRAHRAVF